MAVEPADQPIGMLPEMVVGVETLVRLLDPQEFLLLRAHRIEDRLAVTLALDEEIPTQLSHQRRRLDVLRIRYRRFLVEAERWSLCEMASAAFSAILQDADIPEISQAIARLERAEAELTRIEEAIMVQEGLK